MKTCKYFIKTTYINTGINVPIYLLSLGMVSEDERYLHHQIHYKEYPTVSDDIARTVLINFSHFNMGTLSRNCKMYSSEHDVYKKYTCIEEKHCPWISTDELNEKIRKFTDFNKYGIPEFYGYDCSYDWTLFCQLFEKQEIWSKYFPKYCTDLQQYTKLNSIKNSYEYDSKKYNALTFANFIKNLYYTYNTKYST